MVNKKNKDNEKLDTVLREIQLSNKILNKHYVIDNNNINNVLDNFKDIKENQIVIYSNMIKERKLNL